LNIRDKYKVPSGEALSGIARAVNDSKFGYNRIFEANHNKSSGSNKIKVG
jgi:nucleoid-associated protein YgaU